MVLPSHARLPMPARASPCIIMPAKRLPIRWWIDVGGGESNIRSAVPQMVGDARTLRGVLIERGFELGGALGYHEAPGRATRGRR